MTTSALKQILAGNDADTDALMNDPRTESVLARINADAGGLLGHDALRAERMDDEEPERWDCMS